MPNTHLSVTIYILMNPNDYHSVQSKIESMQHGFEKFVYKQIRQNTAHPFSL